VIGYYAHHRGAGHVHRALTLAARLAEPVTILSSTAPPAGYTGEWVLLPLDHGARDSDPLSDTTANGALHWAPLRSTGLSHRMSTVSAWIAAAAPSVFVVDVSVEIALLARLHGVPVVTMAQPGDRSDPAHTLGYRASSAIIAAWPSTVDPLVVEADVAPRVERVGSISRIQTNDSATERTPDTIAVLGGFGDRGVSRLATLVADARAALPAAHWTTLRGVGERDVARALRGSALVIAHCGQNALAEIAASRIPAIIVAEDRPHDEQRSMARALASSGAPVTVIDRAPQDWAAVVAATSALDGSAWAAWDDGHAADRAAAVIARVASLGSGTAPLHDRVAGTAGAGAEAPADTAAAGLSRAEGAA
jgi:hypothetical protein